MRRAPCALALALGALLLPACRPRAEAARPGDAEIARAADPAERRALEQARDELDARYRREAAAKDAEIARLQRENAELQKRLQSR